jgi:NADH-quinone oxidoreductase subunit M
MVSSTLLTLLLVLPVVTSVTLLLVPESARSVQYSIGLGSTALSTLLSFLLRGSQVSVAGGLRHVRVVPLIPTFPFPVRFGVDGLSLPFIPLTTLFTYLCVLSLSSATPRLREALISLLAIQGAVSATFLALDLFAFFVCFERTLIPIYFLVLL